MHSEEFIKTETEKRIEDLSNKYKEKGLVLGELEKTMIRIGVSYGIVIAGLSLVNTDLTELV